MKLQNTNREWRLKPLIKLFTLFGKIQWLDRKCIVFIIPTRCHESDILGYTSSQVVFERWHQKQIKLQYVTKITTPNIVRISWIWFAYILESHILCWSLHTFFSKILVSKTIQGWLETTAMHHQKMLCWMVWRNIL